jgi:hypothetical protein
MLKSVLAGLTYVTFFCVTLSAATVARFVDYVEFNPYNDGKKITYIDAEQCGDSTKDLDPRYMSCYYDITLNEDQYGGTSSICGRDISDSRSRSVGISLQKSDDKYYFGLSMWLSNVSSESTNRRSTVELGKRYRLLLSKFGLSDNIIHAKIEDVEKKKVKVFSGTATKQATYDYSHKPFGILGMVQGKKLQQSDYYGAKLKIHHARIWYGIGKSKAMTFDLYPCIDTDGNAALYDRIKNKLFYTSTRTTIWSSSGRTSDKSRLVANENTPNSSLARVTSDGEYEFSVEAVAGDGIEFSSDGGVTWVKEYKSWLKSGSESITLKGRLERNDDRGIQPLGWQSSSINPSFYSGEVLGRGSYDLTVPFSGAHSFVIQGEQEGLPENILVDGDFETGGTWFGESGSRYQVTSTTYVNPNCPKDSLGIYVWGLGVENTTVAQDNIKMRPGLYELSLNYAQPDSKTTSSYRGKIKVEFFKNGESLSSATYTSSTLANKYDSIGTVTFSSIQINEGGQYQLRITQEKGSSGAQKIWIDNVSLLLVKPFSGLKVEGEVSDMACSYKSSNGLPYYGSYPLNAGEKILLSAPSGSVAVEGGTTQSQVLGYRIDTWNNDTSEWDKGEGQAGYNVTYEQSGTDMKRLVWLWGGSETVVSVSAGSTGKKVSDDRVNWQDEITKNVSVGDEITLYAGEDDNLAYLWKGLPDNARIEEFGRKVVFTVNEACDISLIGVTTAAAVWSGLAGENFSDEGNWYNGVVPGEGDSVEIPKGAEIIVNDQINVASLSIGVIGEGGSTKVSFENGTGENRVSGDVVLGNGAVLTHKINNNSESYKLNLSVGGDFSILAGAKIDVNSKGYAPGCGPGKTRTGYSGSGSAHGGDGQYYKDEGQNRVYYSIASYGSIKEPFNLGSGGMDSNTTGYGAGVVKLTVGGTLMIEGDVVADATTQDKQPGGTGGSIWLIAAKIIGSGKISASSSGSGEGMHSSGGRIALYQTGTEGWEEFSGSIVASSKEGSGGTIYRQDSTKHGVVTFAESSSTYSNYQQRFPMSADGGSNSDFINDTLVLNDTKVMITSNAKVGDINLVSSNSKILLNGKTLRVSSRAHKDGKNWIGGNYEDRISSGKIVLGDEGKILWNGNFIIKIR